MQIKNKLILKNYILGSILNFLWPIFLYFSLKEYIVLIAFYVSIVLNQYFLFILVADLTGVEKNTTRIPTFIYAVLKLIVLILGFAFAIKLTNNKAHLLVIFYLFQLFVLIFSSRLNIGDNS